jgi:predicted permease
MTKIERIGEIIERAFVAIFLAVFGICLICGMVELFSYCQPLFWIALSILVPVITLISVGAYNFENLYSEKWWKEIKEQNQK